MASLFWQLVHQIEGFKIWCFVAFYHPVRPRYGPRTDVPEKSDTFRFLQKVFRAPLGPSLSEILEKYLKPEAIDWSTKLDGFCGPTASWPRPPNFFVFNSMLFRLCRCFSPEI